MSSAFKIHLSQKKKVIFNIFKSLLILKGLAMNIFSKPPSHLTLGIVPSMSQFFCIVIIYHWLIRWLLCCRYVIARRPPQWVKLLITKSARSISQTFLCPHQCFPSKPMMKVATMVGKLCMNNTESSFIKMTWLITSAK